MARYQLKPNGEIVLMMTLIEARGVAIFARAGYAHFAGRWPGNKIEQTAADRGLECLHQAVSKMEKR